LWACARHGDSLRRLQSRSRHRRAQSSATSLSHGTAQRQTARPDRARLPKGQRVARVASRVVARLSLPPELAEATRARAAQEERTAGAVIRRAPKRDLERPTEAPEQPGAA
jgi:hypothetical protein